jgi:hypothetical protein
MKTKWIASMILAAALIAPAFASAAVYVGPPPPPLRYGVRPPVPRPGYFWRRPQYAGGYWSHPHYDRGWGRHEGRWDHGDRRWDNR